MCQSKGNELLLICIKGSDALTSVVVIINNYIIIIIIIIKTNRISVLVNLKMRMMMFNSCVFVYQFTNTECHRSGYACFTNWPLATTTWCIFQLQVEGTASRYRW
jgi:hypothetical protein